MASNRHSAAFNNPHLGTVTSKWTHCPVASSPFFPSYPFTYSSVYLFDEHGLHPYSIPGMGYRAANSLGTGPDLTDAAF